MESSFESQPRNPVIAKLFRLAHLSENLGYGLRKLKRWQEVTGRPMHIETTINSVKVTFDLRSREAEKSDVGKNVGKNVGKDVGKDVGKKITPRQQMILDLINANPYISMSEMANKIGVATRTIEREISRMNSLVNHSGPKNGGKWHIL